MLTHSVSTDRCFTLCCTEHMLTVSLWSPNKYKCTLNCLEHCCTLVVLDLLCTVYTTVYWLQFDMLCVWLVHVVLRLDSSVFRSICYITLNRKYFLERRVLVSTHATTVTLYSHYSCGVFSGNTIVWVYICWLWLWAALTFVTGTLIFQNGFDVLYLTIQCKQMCHSVHLNLTEEVMHCQWTVSIVLSSLRSYNLVLWPKYLQVISSLTKNI